MSLNAKWVARRKGWKRMRADKSKRGDERLAKIMESDISVFFLLLRASSSIRIVLNLHRYLGYF